jgi:hypothetical protein
MKYKYRLFYYRQEVWTEMLEQNLKPLISSVFEEILPEKAEEVLNDKDRKLGYSKLTFIPKNDDGNLRPIVNMRCSHKTVSYFYIVLFNTLKFINNIITFNLNNKVIFHYW